MRKLYVLRGPQCAGKSTFIKEHGLEPYTICPDEIRMMMNALILDVDGTLRISQDNQDKTWNLVNQLLERRMANGDLCVVDATHQLPSDVMNYKKMCDKYRYRLICIDFTDVDLATVLERNERNVPHKRVPKESIELSFERFKHQLPTSVTVIKPDEFYRNFWWLAEDFSHYKKIHHFGDIHGCFEPINEYFERNGGLKDDELYIFIGDLLDRGIQNTKVLEFCVSIMNRDNVIFIKGNHEIHLVKWANDESVNSRVFDDKTAKELDESSIDKKDVRQLCRKLREFVYYVYNEKIVLVSHGGLSTIPENLTTLSPAQYIKGVGDYNVDIDTIFTNNVGTAEKYQIHGHRNLFRHPIKATNRSFNLEGQIEQGGHLRALTLTTEGFEETYIKNDVYDKKYDIAKILAKNPETVEELLIQLRSNKNVKEFTQDNISSFKHEEKVFHSKSWDKETVRARGLFINVITNNIVARSYDKFFNIGETEETSFVNLSKKLIFPLRIYSKFNGFLGLCGYDEQTDTLVLTSKSRIDGPFAEMFRAIFFDTFDKDQIEEIKKYLKDKNGTLVFEVMDPVRDPHIIEYDKCFIQLLDIVHRTPMYSKEEYAEVVRFATYYNVQYKLLDCVINDWAEFKKWYGYINGKDFKEKIEGYVIEDSNGYMTKVKLHYYTFWKKCRGLVEGIKFGQKMDNSKLKGTNALFDKFFEYISSLDTEELALGMIALRKNFFEATGIVEDSADTIIKKAKN